MAPQLVSELIDSTTATWDMQMLESFFTLADVESIINIPLSTRRQADFWACHHEKKGAFSVRSAYRMLVINKHHATSYIENIAGRSDTKAEEKGMVGDLESRCPVQNTSIPMETCSALPTIGGRPLSLKHGSTEHMRHLWSTGFLEALLD